MILSALEPLLIALKYLMSAIFFACTVVIIFMIATYFSHKDRLDVEDQKRD